MALVELQIRESDFLDAVKAQVLRMDSAFMSIDAILQALSPDLVLERIECEEAGILGAPPEGLTPPPLPGELLVRIKVAAYTTTVHDVEKAGHLQQPVLAKQAPTELFIVLRALGQTKGIRFDVRGGPFAGQTGEFPALKLAAGIPDFVVFYIGLVARDGVVSMRMGTEPEAPTQEAFLGMWNGNRLGGNQWGCFISGTFFAEQLADFLDRAAAQLAQVANDPDIEVLPPKPSGAWSQPVASTSVNLNAVNALPLGFDVEFRVDVNSTLTTAFTSPAPVAAQLTIDTRIKWTAQDLLSDIGLEFSQKAINTVVAAGLPSSLNGAKEVGRGNDFIDYRSFSVFAPPSSPVLSSRITDFAIDESGLRVAGSLAIRPPPTVGWTAEPPRWRFDQDCQTRSVTLQLKGPSVQLLGTDPFVRIHQTRPLRQMPGVFWGTREDAGDFPPVLGISFDPLPDAYLAAAGGIESSVILFTNFGVRHVEFGVIPERPVVSDQEWWSQVASMLSTCMAISDPWGMGVLNLGWLVDPPDLATAGLPAMHEWLIMASGITEVQSVEFNAIGRSGERRFIGSAGVAGGAILHRVLATADEVVEMRTGRPMAGPAPRILHRWVVPAFTARLDTGPGELNDAGIMRQASQPGGSHDVPQASSPAVQDSRQFAPYALDALGNIGKLFGNSVVAIDGDLIVFGVGSAFESYENGVGRTPPAAH